MTVTALDRRDQAERELRTAAAVELARRLAQDIADPEAFVVRLGTGLHALASPEDLAETQRVAPGIDGAVGTGWYLVEVIGRELRRETRTDSPTVVLFAVERMFRMPELEARWLAISALEPLVVAAPERAWQLLRRAGREARDWITVDALAHPFGRGILAEEYRWAELEQLVFAPSRWERRLVGSTIATIPYVDHRAGRQPLVAEQSLPLVDALIGDDDPIVQKALSWALRSLTIVDPDAVGDFADRQAQVAVERDDGHRAWVIRDALTRLQPDRAARLRGQLAGVRKRPGAPSTSIASATAAAFVAAGGIPPLS